MLKPSKRTLRVLATALAIGLLCGGLALAEKGDKKKPRPEPPPEPTPADPAIAFSLNGALTVMNADGSNVITIFDPDGRVNDISWSPDIDGDPSNGYQGSLVFERQFSQEGVRWDLWVIDVIVTEQGVVAANLTNLVPADTWNPAWSPHGDLIAFDGLVDGQGGVFVISPAGGSPALVVQDPADGYVGWPTWSPDGTYLAYARKSSGLWSLLLKQVVDPDTGDLIDGPETVVIPEEAGFTWIVELDWGRDGASIAFLGEDETLSGGIYIVEAAEWGVFLEVETTAAQSGNGVTWSPDDPATLDIDETDQFLLYPEFAKPPRRRLVRQELATGVETVVFDKKRQYANFPDWRRF